jgi:endonuclease YncB( thermonuclease family)
LTLLTLLLVACTTAQAAEDIVGAARVVDGDTIVVQQVKVRLEGIDAPEHGQMCTANGIPWACGDNATAWLADFLAEREVACVSKGHDRYGRLLATCFVGGENLNDRIVREGWALDFRRYTSAYLEAEDDAKRTRAGLWRFEPPWEWRQHH